MKFPRTLDEWNYTIIKELVDKNYSETEFFDFKTDLLEPKKQEKIVCSFANTNGGFLIFGIRDKKETNRIIGIELKKDFQTHFYDRINMIEPTVYFEFKQPPIQIPDSDRIIPVCYIPQSNEKPHITREKLFYIKTSGGSNDLMNYNQIRESFYGFEQRKIKVEMLGLELEYLNEIIRGMIVPANEMEEKYSLYDPQSSLLVDLMGQIYPIIKNDQELISKLFTIRCDLDTLNQCNKTFLFQTALPMTGRQLLILEYNKKVQKLAQSLIMNITAVFDILREKYEYKIST
ncbi:MAG: ATP-binding protein [Asgard group archaeon]|nr:ATP-binding protein [Asgard group archaeon]